jgi:hypothetical protein
MGKIIRRDLGVSILRDPVLDLIRQFATVELASPPSVSRS